MTGPGLSLSQGRDGETEAYAEGQRRDGTCARAWVRTVSESGIRAGTRPMPESAFRSETDGVRAGQGRGRDRAGA